MYEFSKYYSDICEPYSQEACRAAGARLGLTLGGNGHPFVGKYSTKGCYAYNCGKYNGRMYYGTGGTMEQMKESPDAPKYRPKGYDYDCSGNSKFSILFFNCLQGWTSKIISRLLYLLFYIKYLYLLFIK